VIRKSIKGAMLASWKARKLGGWETEKLEGRVAGR